MVECLARDKGPEQDATPSLTTTKEEVKLSMSTSTTRRWAGRREIETQIRKIWE
jgi:hypothetical protein